MKLSLLLLSLIAAVTMAGSSAPADPIGTHGFLLFGKQTIYASHLPMYHSPHDYQVLLQVSIESGRKPEVAEAYYNKKDNEYFTVVPKPMDLTDVINGKIKGFFFADLYQGHFEKSGKYIGSVMVHIEKVLYSKKLNPTDNSPAEFLVFGSKGEYFAANMIGGKPSFDQILSVSAPYSVPTHYCRTRSCGIETNTPILDSALPMKISASDLNPATGGEALGDLLSALVDVKSVIYLETNDLAQ